ncbi:hypothetical protein CRENPOLYSF2_1960002 [Crenothrix polyspora]|uniref:Uncharacterized protein n=1 Tax=Crenothrix polyspora TaxID=360316 RepID=A0A1R4H3V7_9GAMM|nr:hypothetical protein CRENPOLYSF2_1960002 [Crenothrix polyspora]
MREETHAIASQASIFFAFYTVEKAVPTISTNTYSIANPLFLWLANVSKR